MFSKRLYQVTFFKNTTFVWSGKKLDSYFEEKINMFDWTAGKINQQPNVT